jgi:hypothetical protein
MVKLFTNPKGQSIAVNPELVIMVTEEDNGTMLKFSIGSQLVTENFLDVIARLNEKK